MIKRKTNNQCLINLFDFKTAPVNNSDEKGDKKYRYRLSKYEPALRPKNF